MFNFSTHLWFFPCMLSEVGTKGFLPLNESQLFLTLIKEPVLNIYM